MGLDASLAALADPTRRELLRLVGERQRKAGELAEAFPVSRPAVSKHLRVLREAGLVEAESRGRARIYRLAPGGISEVRRWVEETGRLWDSALEAFRAHVEGVGP
ncbi:MAG TPA: metalloregulator ArsR/SmtB family transcription factor [Actinomycetota bacterium]|nr:metalloregulator ArsR/SmtB family transcription factor [Actinomycetota bacterium]